MTGKEALNSRLREERDAAVDAILEKIRKGEVVRTRTDEVNNHVHTFHSFSPYSPSGAVYEAWEAGLGIVGLVDHDTLSGAEEMLTAGRRFSMASTVGFELRVSFRLTPFSGRRINNPDSTGIAYMCVHGVPHTRIEEAEAFLSPIREARRKRSRTITEKINRLSLGVTLDYDKDVEGISHVNEGGTVTERHILYALAGKIVDKYEKGKGTVEYLSEHLRIVLDPKAEGRLLDKENPYYRYDLLGVLKTMLLPAVYIEPGDEECPDVRDVLAFSERIGAVSAYAYLGDVERDVTGDKKREKFEDEYLDELIPYLKELGFRAVTYMPPRNSEKQMKRLIALSKENGLMEISGVDINSPRQSFSSPEVLSPVCRHLVDSAWALVAHEKLSSEDSRFGLFSPGNPIITLPLEKRLEIYASIGKGMNHGEVKRSAQKYIETIGGYYGM